MIPKRAIELSIEGGWQGQIAPRLKEELAQEFHSGVYIQWEQITLDPTFWQGLGKALGWFGDLSPLHRYEKSPGVWADPMWIINAKIFYDLILTGGDTAAFWRELLAPNDK